MKGYLKTSEIGLHSVVAYRAKALGIKPIGTVLSSGRNENMYSIEDAQKILTYRAVIKYHSIAHFDKFALIVKDPKFKNNIPLASRKFDISEAKLRNMIDEYNKSGCFIVSSKMNHKNLIRWISKGES